jgi:hypothetical protein
MDDLPESGSEGGESTQLGDAVDLVPEPAARPCEIAEDPDAPGLSPGIEVRARGRRATWRFYVSRSTRRD